jgi:hypothetical protein
MGKFGVINKILKKIRQYVQKLKYEMHWELWKLGNKYKDSAETHIIKIVVIVILKTVWSRTHQI